MKNDLPPVDPDLEWLRQLLWDMYEARVRCPDGRLPIEELKDPALVQLLTDQFQDLLRVVRDALGMKRDAPDVKIPEATYRSGFDRLIRLFFDGAGEAAAKRLSMCVISGSVFFITFYPTLICIAPAWSPGFQCHGMIWLMR